MSRPFFPLFKHFFWEQLLDRSSDVAGTDLIDQSNVAAFRKMLHKYGLMPKEKKLVLQLGLNITLFVFKENVVALNLSVY